MKRSRTVWSVLGAAALVMVAGACGSSVSGPTETASALGATIQGTVQAPRTAINVSVTGTALSTTTDSAGRFTLSDVPAGSATLRFTGGGVDAQLQLTGLTRRRCTRSRGRARAAARTCLRADAPSWAGCSPGRRAGAGSAKGLAALRTEARRATRSWRDNADTSSAPARSAAAPPPRRQRLRHHLGHPLGHDLAHRDARTDADARTRRAAAALARRRERDRARRLELRVARRDRRPCPCRCALRAASAARRAASGSRASRR